MAKSAMIPVSLILLAVLAAGCGGRAGTTRAPGPGVQTAPAAASPPVPELLFSANRSVRPTITQGMPLIFAVMIRNGPAARAAFEALARANRARDLDEQVRAGTLSRQQADARLRQIPIPPSVSAIAITVSPANFTFTALPGSTNVPLPWQPKMADPGIPTRVTLNEKQVTYVTFVEAPEGTASTPKGTYRLRVTFESHAASQWQGKVTSNPVTVTVVEAPSAPTADDQKKQRLWQGEYFLAVKDYDRAMATARDVLSLSSDSIDGHILLGQAQEGKGDLRAALDAYESALQEFHDKLPGDHPPQTLLAKIDQLRARLGIKLPDVIDNPPRR